MIACKKEKIFSIITSPAFEGKKDNFLALISIDEKFLDIIFLTYRNFATGQEMLEHLIKSFFVRLSDSPTEQEMSTYEKYHSVSRYKILKVLHFWIEHHWHDFGLKTDLRSLLNAFLAQLCAYENGQYSEVARGLLFVADIQVFASILFSNLSKLAPMV